jgi:hypothetical protein
LEEDFSFAAVLDRLGPLREPERAFQLLSRITTHPDSAAEIAALSASIPSDPRRNAVERVLLLLASLHAMAKVPGLEVSDSVKGLFADEFRSFANPPAAWAAHFGAQDALYREMARVATLRRFPAGQFHWEVSGFPRSWLLKTRKPWKALAAVLGPMGGFAPYFDLHVNERRRNRLVLLEKEANLSYYRTARSIEKEPGVRGLMSASWLFCESTAQVTPRLGWLRRTPQSAGASIVVLGPAARDAGFLKGSDERRKLYEQGVYRPRVACLLWPRKLLIEWADRHPEFDE